MAGLVYVAALHSLVFHRLVYSGICCTASCSAEHVDRSASFYVSVPVINRGKHKLCL